MVVVNREIWEKEEEKKQGIDGTVTAVTLLCFTDSIFLTYLHALEIYNIHLFACNVLY